MQFITILGATGTIGVNTLDVIAQHADKYRVFALTAQKNWKLLLTQCLQFSPDYAVVLDEYAAKALTLALKDNGCHTQVLCGESALCDVSRHSDVDMVMAAIVGAAGLHPAMAAAHAGKKILLANKETLVVAGRLFMDAVKSSGATLLPIDSEHNAIFQSLPHDYQGDAVAAGVKRIILTASGGPFRALSFEDLQSVTPAQACKHPNWVMGQKISVDSASLMNKGLEVIEAHWLFNLPASQINVVVHPQSVVHSLVEYVDGSMLAQLGSPDMRTPIAYGLAYPSRIHAGVKPLDLLSMGDLSFYPPDMQKFPCLQLAFDALTMAGVAPTVLNAANEVAVAGFLAGQVRFVDIPKIVASALEQNYAQQAVESIEQLSEIDLQTRHFSGQYLS